MTKISELIKNYKLYLELEKNYSIKTIENYSLWLNRFQTFSNNIDVKDITNFLILEFRWNLKELWLGKNTINYHIVALRAFLKYLHKNDIKTLR